MVSTRSQRQRETTIDDLNLDVLQNIVSRLPAVSFACAACVSPSWSVACSRVLCRPKLSSACFMNESLNVAVEGVLDKVLSQPIRPHFALASVSNSEWLDEAHQLLGSTIPLITISGEGCFGRDASSNEFVEWGPRGEANFDHDGYTITLTIGFLPGVKVKKIPLIEPIEASGAPVIDKFITDIWEFSDSVSGCKSPAAVMMFNVSPAAQWRSLKICITGAEIHYDVCVAYYYTCQNNPDDGYLTPILEKINCSLSPETVIVGGSGNAFRCADSEERNPVVALVFVVDRNKPSGIGETRFHAVSSSGLLPVDPVYKVTSVKEETDMDDKHFSTLTIRRDGSHENLDIETIVDQAVERFEIKYCDSDRKYIGVSKRREGMTSLAFYEILDDLKDLSVYGLGIKRGDTFRFYHSPQSSAIASSSIVDLTNHLRSFKIKSTTGGDKLEVFGGVVFPSFSRDFSLEYKLEPYGEESDSFPFLDNFPAATLGGVFCHIGIARCELIPFAKEQNPGRCCSLLNHGVVNLILSYDAKQISCD